MIGFKNLVVEDDYLAVREDHPLLEVVDAHASHETPQGSRFQRRGKRRVPRINSPLREYVSPGTPRQSPSLGHRRPCLVSAA